MKILNIIRRCLGFGPHDKVHLAIPEKITKKTAAGVADLAAQKAKKEVAEAVEAFESKLKIPADEFTQNPNTQESLRQIGKLKNENTDLERTNSTLTDMLGRSSYKETNISVQSATQTIIKEEQLQTQATKVWGEKPELPTHTTQSEVHSVAGNEQPQIQATTVLGEKPELPTHTTRSEVQSVAENEQPQTQITTRQIKPETPIIPSHLKLSPLNGLIDKEHFMFCLSLLKKLQSVTPPDPPKVWYEPLHPNDSFGSKKCTENIHVYIDTKVADYIKRLESAISERLKDVKDYTCEMGNYSWGRGINIYIYDKKTNWSFFTISPTGTSEGADYKRILYNYSPKTDKKHGEICYAELSFYDGTVYFIKLMNSPNMYKEYPRGVAILGEKKNVYPVDDYNKTVIYVIPPDRPKDVTLKELKENFMEILSKPNANIIRLEKIYKRLGLKPEDMENFLEPFFK